MNLVAGISGVVFSQRRTSEAKYARKNEIFSESWQIDKAMRNFHAFW